MYPVGICAQESRSEFFVNFPIGVSVINENFMYNATELDELRTFVADLRVDTLSRIVAVRFCGTVSPEGADQRNRQLARERMQAMENLVRKYIEIDSSLVSYEEGYISWMSLAAHIEASSYEWRDEALAILSAGDDSDDNNELRAEKLKALNDGKAWTQLNREYFSQMRYAYAVFELYREPLPADPLVLVESESELQPQSLPEFTEPEPLSGQEEGWTRRLHLKTNALEWVIILPNVAVEIDLAQHWSFNLPIFYSAMNYFTARNKFRGVGMQPEFRYWFRDDNDAWFVGAHFGLAYYNIALKSGDRLQSHDREKPALGGGIAFGYRMPIGKKKRWRAEFSLGAGAYALDYDKFYNVSNGLRHERVQKTYWGLDQAAVSFGYTFDLKKRKGGAK